MTNRITDAKDLPRVESQIAQCNASIGPPEKGMGTPEEIEELVGKARRVLGECPANSSISSGGYSQRVVYPKDSILDDWMQFARQQVESADAFIIGSILPVCAALLGRRIYFRWGELRIFPNCFNMLAGKPGDRKTSAIGLAETLARRVLSETAFIPKSFSPEALFEEFSEDHGGRPDKLWIVDEANPILTDWRKSATGERVAPRFLELYDCNTISENFRRNGKGNKRRRTIPQTSTSLLFGATFISPVFKARRFGKV